MADKKNTPDKERWKVLVEGYLSTHETPKFGKAELTLHWSRRPFDYCPFECDLCEVFRRIDRNLVGKESSPPPSNTGANPVEYTDQKSGPTQPNTRLRGQ